MITILTAKLAAASLAICCAGGAMIATSTPPSSDSCCAPSSNGEAVSLVAFTQTTETSQPAKMKKPAKPDFHVVAMSKYSFSDTVDILKGTIEENNLMVVHEINGQKMLRMVNVQTKGMKQIMFFHPRYMKQIRELNPNAMIEPPLKVAVMERPDGKVMIRYIKPTYQIGQYEGLEDLGKELEGLVVKIVNAAKN